MTKPAIPEDGPDFSLVLGGPLFQLFRRARLSGDALELLHRRMLVITGVAWVPLLLLSAFAGHAVGGAIEIPFLYDIEAHVRFLIALPLLIAAELIVHLGLRPEVRQFVERRIVLPEDMPKFHEAINSTLRLRNSVMGEVALLVLVYTIGLWVWRSQIALETASWYAIPGAGRIHLTPAGYWYVFVSVPIFHFILLRWYLRIFLWFSFLWRVSRLNLRLMPVHPDRAGGLSFLGRSTDAFLPIIFAQGALLAALAATQIFHAGQNLMAFKIEIAVFVVFFVAIMLGPLTVFTPHLARAKRHGLTACGALASRYAGKFQEKWVGAADEELLGSGDIQSLADLGTSYTVVQDMRPVPFRLQDVTKLAGAAVVPLLPLTLTLFSLEELVTQLIKVLF